MLLPGDRGEKEIPRIVVPFDPVFMVNDFPRSNGAPELFLGD